MYKTNPLIFHTQLEILAHPGRSHPCPYKAFTVVMDSGAGSVPLRVARPREVLDTASQIIRGALSFFSPGKSDASRVAARMPDRLPPWQAARRPGDWKVGCMLWGTEQMAPHSPEDTDGGIIFPKDGSCLSP